MTSTENLGNCYILTGEVDGQRASVYLLDNPDSTTTVVNEIMTRANLILSLIHISEPTRPY